MGAERKHAGNQKDASPADKREMYKKISVLHSLLRTFVHRCGPELLRQELPPKQEHIVLFRLSPVQDALYKALLPLMKVALLPPSASCASRHGFLL